MITSFKFNVEFEEQLYFKKLATRMNPRTYNLINIPEPQKHAGRHIFFTS